MRKATVALLVLALLLAPSCYTFKHTVGTGPSTGQVEEEGAWFAFWGLLPITKPDSKAMAGGAANYRVTTQFTFLDCVITFFTGIVTIHKQTVQVEK